MSTTTITHHDTAAYHHMPDGAERIDLTGLTLRQALRAIRAMDLGSLGGCTGIDLSDGTYLDIVNAPASGGGQLMGVHRIQRLSRGEVVATYSV